MRKVATVKKENPNDALVKRIIVHASEHGVFMYPCASLEDGSATGDEWCESVEQADEVCLRDFGIGADDWEYIDDPAEGCQHDWIAPVRVKGRNIGQPQWGCLERLEDGIWEDVEPTCVMPEVGGQS